MQSTLRDANLSQPNTPISNNPFSGGVWSSGKSWLLAAATISTVVLIALSIWQRQEINQLRQTITQQVHPQPTNPSASDSQEQGRRDVARSGNATLSQPERESTTSANRNESQGVRPDTVYITRYIPVPSRTNPDLRNEERLSQRLETPLEQRYATEKAKPSPTTLNQPTYKTNNQPIELYDASSTLSSVAKNPANESTAVTKSTNSSSRNNEPGNQTIRERGTKQSDSSPENSVHNQRRNTVNPDTAPNNKAIQTESPATTNGGSVSYEPVAGLPLSVDSKNWNTALAQRAKRMRPARPAVVVVEQPQVPESQPVQRVTTHFRVGIGGEVASRLWSAGVFTEVLLGNHWSVGIGLSQATYLSKFITEEDFNDRTHRDFRKEFARPGDLWRDILNIDTRQTRLQVPVNLGYRIPLNQRLTLLPTVGTYLNVSNSENVTYYCRDILRPPMQPQSQRGFDEISTSKSQSVDLISNLVFGAGIEWQRGHWALQGIPVITIPTEANPQPKQPDMTWQRNTTVGLRARLLYQF